MGECGGEGGGPSLEGVVPLVFLFHPHFVYGLWWTGFMKTGCQATHASQLKFIIVFATKGWFPYISPFPPSFHFYVILFMVFAWADSMSSEHQLSVHSCLTPGRHRVILTAVSFTHTLLIGSVICSLYVKSIPTKIYKGIGHMNVKLNWPNLLSPQVDGFLEIQICLRQNQICFYLFPFGKQQN